MLQNKFARSIQEQIYTIDSKISPTLSFLTATTFCHSGVFLQTTSETIYMIFHMYNTQTNTKEYGYLLMQRASSIFNNNNLTSQISTHFTDEKHNLLSSEVAKPLIMIFNLSLSSGIVPEKLKTAKVIPIFKKQDPEALIGSSGTEVDNNYSTPIQPCQLPFGYQNFESNMIVCQKCKMFRISEVNVLEITFRISERLFGYVVTLRLICDRSTSCASALLICMNAYMYVRPWATYVDRGCTKR